MGEGLKKRLLGAAVLLGLLIILAPALFRGGSNHPLVVGELSQDTQLQPPPVPDFVDHLDVPPEVVTVMPALEESPPSPEESVPLPEASVPVAAKGDAPENAGPDTGVDDKGHLKAWTLQLATFANKDNARKLEQKLKSDGYSAYQKTFVNSGGKSFYRVFIGPEVRPEELQQLRLVIEKTMGLEGVVVRFVP